MLEAELDSIEWELATNERVPAGTRLRAVQTIRARVFGQGRRDGHVTTSGHVVPASNPALASEASQHTARRESLVTDAQLRSMPTDLLERFLELLREVTRYGEPNDKQRDLLGQA